MDGTIYVCCLFERQETREVSYTMIWGVREGGIENEIEGSEKEKE